MTVITGSKKLSDEGAALFTARVHAIVQPGMGVILWGGSPLQEIHCSP